MARERTRFRVGVEKQRLIVGMWRARRSWRKLLRRKIDVVKPRGLIYFGHRSGEYARREQVAHVAEHAHDTTIATDREVLCVKPLQRFEVATEHTLEGVGADRGLRHHRALETVATRHEGHRRLSSAKEQRCRLLG